MITTHTTHISSVPSSSSVVSKNIAEKTNNSGATERNAQSATKPAAYLEKSHPTQKRLLRFLSYKPGMSVPKGHTVLKVNDGRDRIVVPPVRLPGGVNRIEIDGVWYDPADEETYISPYGNEKWNPNAGTSTAASSASRKINPRDFLGKRFVEGKAQDPFDYPSTSHQKTHWVPQAAYGVQPRDSQYDGLATHNLHECMSVTAHNQSRTFMAHLEAKTRQAAHVPKLLKKEGFSAEDTEISIIGGNDLSAQTFGALYGDLTREGYSVRETNIGDAWQDRPSAVAINCRNGEISDAHELSKKIPMKSYGLCFSGRAQLTHFDPGAMNNDIAGRIHSAEGPYEGDTYTGLDEEGRIIAWREGESGAWIPY